MMKYLYFLLLLSIVAGVGYVLALRFLYFRGNGQVEIEKRILSSQKPGKVKVVYRAQGEEFSTGDVLAVIDLDRDCGQVAPPDSRPARLAHEIKRLQAEHRVYRSKHSALKLEAPDAVLRRALEIGTTDSARRESERIQREQQRLKEKMALLAAEIEVKKIELAALETELAVTSGPACELETIYAPFDGVVRHVTRKQDEFIDKGEPLMVVLPDQAEVAVDAYFDWKVLRFVDQGDTMTITFPDGSSGQGTVAGFASASTQAPVRDRKNYVPVESKLLIHIIPQNDKDRLHWQQYDRMDVLVTGERK